MPFPALDKRNNIKVVFDTNIFISMLIWRQKHLEFLYILFKQKQITVFIIPEIIEEIERVLNYPKFTTPLLRANLKVDDIIKIISEYCSVLSSPSKIHQIIENDPDDNVFLACALKAKADFIISGDDHLLKLKEYQDIQIVTPKEFINCISSR